MRSDKLNGDFKIFRDHCIIIRRNFNTYNELFSSENKSLLTVIASTFFNDIAEILQRDWVLQACKLMDPSSTNIKGQVAENISIELINSQLSEHGLLNDEVLAVSGALKEYGVKITPARNKRIAHFDREHHVKNIILGETSEQDLDDFISNIQIYCDVVGNITNQGPLDFSCSSCSGDVGDLLSFLLINSEKNS